MITLRVSEQRLERLDAAIENGGFASRAAALNAALDRVLAETEERQIDRAIVEGYTRAPQTEADDAAARAAGRRSIAAERW